MLTSLDANGSVNAFIINIICIFILFKNIRLDHLVGPVVWLELFDGGGVSCLVFCWQGRLLVGWALGWFIGWLWGMVGELLGHGGVMVVGVEGGVRAR